MPSSIAWSLAGKRMEDLPGVWSALLLCWLYAPQSHFDLGGGGIQAQRCYC